MLYCVYMCYVLLSWFTFEYVCVWRCCADVDVVEYVLCVCDSCFEYVNMSVCGLCVVCVCFCIDIEVSSFVWYFACVLCKYCVCVCLCVSCLFVCVCDVYCFCILCGVFVCVG